MSSRIHSHLRGNVVAYLALFFALTGTAIAATAPRNSVTSKSIKDGQVKSVDAEDDGLTGTDILESGLGQVPSAANALALDGTPANRVKARRIDFDAISPTPLTTLFTIGTVEIKARCEQDGANTRGGLFVRSNGADAETHAFGVLFDAGTAATTPFTGGGPVSANTDAPFFFTTTTTPTGVARVGATINVSSPSTSISISQHTVIDPATDSCKIVGQATPAT